MSSRAHRPGRTYRGWRSWSPRCRARTPWRCRNGLHDLVGRYLRLHAGGCDSSIARDDICASARAAALVAVPGPAPSPVRSAHDRTRERGARIRPPGPAPSPVQSPHDRTRERGPRIGPPDTALSPVRSAHDRTRERGARIGVPGRAPSPVQSPHDRTAPYFSRPYNFLLAGDDWRFFGYPVSDDALEGDDRLAPPPAVIRLHRALGDETRLRILKLLASSCWPRRTCT